MGVLSTWFFDASYDLEINKRTFNSIKSALTAEALICVHDTGLWKKEVFEPIDHMVVESTGKEFWINEESYAHQNDERKFVKWIRKEYPEFEVVLFHSHRSLRHGLSVLQAKGDLATV